MILGIAEDETGFPIPDNLGGTGIGAGDNREAAGHGLQNGQIECILERGTNIKVGSGIKRGDVR